MKHTNSSKVISLLILGTILLAATGCLPRARVGALQTEFQSVALGDAEAVRVEIEFGAGDLQVTGGADQLLEADFAYNVARHKPEVEYTDGTLVVRQPEVKGLPVLRDMDGYRNEWELRFNEEVPMDLSVTVGAGTSDLQLAGLSLTGVNIEQGAGETTVDLSGDWARDLDVTIDAGAGEVTLRLPGEVGARVEVNTGLGEIIAPGMTKDGDFYTNAAYGVSDVTIQVDLEAGVGQINLEVVEAGASEAEQAETPDYSSITEELSQQIQAIVDEAGITGLSVALVDDQEMVWSEGFGYADKANGVAATPETLYMVASISKLFTASAIMQLAEQSKIDIDQPVQTYVPGFSINSRFPEAGPITPRTLMTHHSGLPSDSTNGMLAFGDDLEAMTISEFQDMVPEFKQMYVNNPPNTFFSYSNLGYSLLGHTVEQVTGQEFSDYMDKAILGPLGMDSSSFTIKPGMKERLSKEYLKGEEQDRMWTRDISAATLRSSVQDLSRFMMMVFGDGELDGQRILREETLAEMIRPQNSDVPLDLGAQWGLGWWLLPIVDYAGVNAWHSGGDVNWNSLLVTLPEHKLGVVLLSNSAEAGDVVYQIAGAVLEQALKVKAGIERPPAESQAVVALSADELRSYEGTYTTDIGWIIIRSDGTDLFSDVNGQSFKLLPHGEGRFSVEGVPASEASVTIKEVDGRTAMSIYGLAFGGLTYGERLEPASISEAWMDRVGSYEITNAKPGFHTFLADVQLKYENDLLMMNVTRTDDGSQYAFPIGPVSDDEAVVLGLGLRDRGETISVVEEDGKEQLFYSGYLMRKVQVTELLQRVLEAAVESPDSVFPGALMYVSSPELGTWGGAAGLGDIETNTPMRPDDRFRAGSLLKPFTAVVILQLVEEGLFSLDDPMTAVLPESVTGKFVDSDRITVRMLLNHTSGIPEWSTDAVDAEFTSNPAKVWDVDEFLDLAAAQEPDFAPGEGYAYSNTGYNLLSLVIEEATGRSWREEVSQRIIQQLGLENTSLPEPGGTSIAGAHAHGYHPLDGQLVDFTEVDPSMAGAAGGGALVTTAPDLARFLDALRAGELFQESGSLDEMLAFIDAPDENGFPYWYGLGLERYVLPGDGEMIGHLGCTAGYCSAVYYLPVQDTTIAASINFRDAGSFYLQLLLPALETLIPGFSVSEPPAAQGAGYEDPEGRFSLPLIGEWEQVETDGSYALFEVTGYDLSMSVHSVESGDLVAGEAAALDQAGIDPSTLKRPDHAGFGPWNVTFYAQGEGQGVTTMCQVDGTVTYCLIFSGEETQTKNPPEHVFMTFQGFTIHGKQSSLPGTVEDFEAYVNSFVGDNPPGLSIVINLGGEALYSQGFGVADGPNDMPADPDTVYPWGSSTKIVTGTAVMQLVDQGLVDLDAPVSDYLEYFPAEHGITVRQLLDHSAGLAEPPGFLQGKLRLEGQPLVDFDQTAREYVEWLSEPMFEPGSQSSYSNPGFVMLGQIVAAASGQPFVEYVQEHILKPLGMVNTDFTYSNQAMIDHAAAPAIPASTVEDLITVVDQAKGQVTGADLIREVDDQFAWMNRFYVLAANGGLIGPATEFMRFAQMHLNGGELDGVRILSPESVALMQVMQKSTAGDPLGYGAAWRVFDDAEHPFVEHDGGGEGLWAKMRIYPQEGLAIVLMSNQSGWNRDQVADAAANVVFTMTNQ